LLALLTTLCAAWLPGLKLAFGPNASYYAFGYVGDEYVYAQRIQPLIAGTTATNPVNGICDSGVISPYYLEDLLRVVLTYSGIDVIALFWIWRGVFPVLLACGMVLLAGSCLKR
jgi:hypothetical protein